MEDILEISREVRQKAYAPYSGYRVGAALEAADGELYSGCNVEIANYSNSLHAEEVALSNAVADGKQEFDALAVSSENGAPPCGMCRQTLSEFCDSEFVILVDAVESGEVHEFTIGELYPTAFDERFIQNP